MLYKTSYDSPIGPIIMLANDHGLLGAWYENQEHFAGTFDLKKARTLENTADQAILQEASDWFDAYFAGQNPSVNNLPLMPQGTAFQQEVWAELIKVGYGETISYQELADRVAARQSKGRGSARAVGGAVGRNPISIIIPCHRVIASNGDLTGYAGGIDKKITLLKIEGIPPKI
jgi:methylated-DNA-[protein]-cysteine S-methyltransferase